MITKDGWLDWAIKYPRKDGELRVNPGENEAKGIFLHSAEGYKSNLLDLAISGPLSWHFSNMIDGTFYQHYPITARCWHATAANQSFLGMENEGTYQLEPSLNDLQVENAIRCIKEISTLKGWTPNRDIDYHTRTLWEHNQVTELGGSSTACPSGRIPWDKIMKGLTPMPDAPTIEAQIKALVALAHFIRNGWNVADLSPEDKAAIHYAAESVPEV